MVCNQEIIDTIKVMRMQEVTVYAVASDYLHQHQPQVDAMRGPINSKGLSVDADCRFKMAEWKRQVVDFCKFQRETVAISMSYLDRFLASPGGVDARHNRKIYQLASMAALYTAIKVNEPEAVDPKTVAGLSRGAHTEEQVEDMERQILFSIDWRLHPPTALAFCISLSLTSWTFFDDRSMPITLANECSAWMSTVASSDWIALTIAAKAIVEGFTPT